MPQPSGRNPGERMASQLILLLILGVPSAALVSVAVHTVRTLRAGLRLKTSGISTNGQCVSLAWREDEVSVRFSYALPDGTKHEADSFWMSRTSMCPGTTVSLVYDPASPESAELTECLEPGIRFRRRVLLGVVPVLVLFAAFDTIVLLALFL